MTYKEILLQIAIKEGTTVKEVEEEMRKALNLAGVKSSPKKFLKKITKQAAKTIYSNIV